MDEIELVAANLYQDGASQSGAYQHIINIRSQTALSAVGLDNITPVHSVPNLFCYVIFTGCALWYGLSSNLQFLLTVASMISPHRIYLATQLHRVEYPFSATSKQNFLRNPITTHNLHQRIAGYCIIDRYVCIMTYKSYKSL